MAGSITLLTRPGCELCHEALGHLRPWADRLRLEVREVDIDGDRDLTRQFGFRIPVFLDDSGRVLAEGRIEGRQAAVAALRARLARSAK
ncbi:MAG TPA: glutaredoxin family protein [Acidimicrobiia bacterium]|nr:glutaredoxin family protein [Acidimicrobiia bacterium]